MPGSTLPQYDNPLFNEATQRASETDGPGDLQRVDASEIVPPVRTTAARGQLTGAVTGSQRTEAQSDRSPLRIGIVALAAVAALAVGYWGYRSYLSGRKPKPKPNTASPRIHATSKQRPSQPTSPGARPRPRPKPTGKLVVLQPFQADCLSPMKVTNAEGIDIVQQTHEPLVTYDVLTGQIQQALAVKWQRTKNGYTFELRKGVKFHDGTPLTAGEVVRSLRAAVKSRSGSGYLSDAVEIKATGERSLAIQVRQHSASFLIRLSLYPYLISRPGKEFPVGTGPYRVTLWNQRIGAVVLEAFPGYWGGAPRLKSIVFKSEPESAARASYLRQGSVHLAMALPTHIAKKLETNLEVVVASSAQNSLTYLMFNTQKPYLRDPRIRRALTMAVDRERLIRELYMGSASLAVSSVPPSLLRIKGENKPVRFEPKKVHKLLAGTGIAKRTLTLYMYADARPSMPQPKLAAKIMRESFVAAGLKVRTVLLPYKAAKRACQLGKHDMCFLGWALDYPDAENLYFLISRKGTKAGWNYAHFDDDEYERLLAAVELEPDHNKRIAMFAKLEAIVVEKRPWLPIAYVATYFARRAEVKGVIFDIAQLNGIDLRKAYFGK